MLGSGHRNSFVAVHSELDLVERVQHFRWLPCTLRFEVTMVRPGSASPRAKSTASRRSI